MEGEAGQLSNPSPGPPPCLPARALSPNLQTLPWVRCPGEGLWESDSPKSSPPSGPITPLREDCAWRAAPATSPALTWEDVPLPVTVTRADATLFRPHTFGHLEQSHSKQEQGHLVQAGAFLAPGSSYQLPAFMCAVLGTHCSRGPCDGMLGTRSGCSLCSPFPTPRAESAHERVKEGMSRWANKPTSRADVLMGCTNPWEDKGWDSLLGWDLLLRLGLGKGPHLRRGGHARGQRGQAVPGT